MPIAGHENTLCQPLCIMQYAETNARRAREGNATNVMRPGLITRRKLPPSITDITSSLLFLHSSRNEYKGTEEFGCKRSKTWVFPNALCFHGTYF